MAYQLVLQFRGDSVDDLDAIVALEDSLIELLGERATVDGHDIGSGEINVFILTSDPFDTFAAVQPMLGRANILANTTAAYRSVDSGEYTIVWPKDPIKAFSVA